MSADLLRMTGILGALAVVETPVAAQESITPQNVLEHSLKVVDKAAEDLPDSPLPPYVRGGAYFRSQRYRDAIEAYKEALKRQPKSPEIRYHLALTYSESHQYEEAIGWYRKVIEVRPDFPQANRRLGQALLEENRVDEAIDAFKQALKHHPDSALAHYYLGEAYEQAGRHAEAIAHARTTLNLDDRYPEPYYLLAKAYRAEGKPDKAKKALIQFQEKKRAETEELDSVEPITDQESALRAAAATHFEVGEAYQAHGRVEAAIAQYRRAMELDEDHVEARLRLLTLYQQEGKLDRALSLARELIARDPDHPRYRMALGMLLARRGNWKEARAELARAYELAPEDRGIARRYAQTLLQGSPNPQEALTVLSELTAEGAGQARDYDLLSRAYYMLGNMKQSLAAMKEAIERAPKNKVYRKRYQQLKARAGP